MKTVFDSYPGGQIFLEPSSLESNFAVGQELVVKIRAGDEPAEDTRAAVRAFLEQHAQVIGSRAVATVRLGLYEEAGGLTDAELADRLERLITVSLRSGRRLIELDGGAAATFSNMFR